MLWDVEILVPNYGLWWTRWALYVMLWNVPRYAERGNRNSTLCITWKKKASHVALRIHKYGEGTIRVGVTDDAVFCFNPFSAIHISPNRNSYATFTSVGSEIPYWLHDAYFRLRVNLKHALGRYIYRPAVTQRVKNLIFFCHGYHWHPWHWTTLHHW